MTEKEKAGIITVRLGGGYVSKLDQLCQDMYRTRAKQLQALIDVGMLVRDLDQRTSSRGRDSCRKGSPGGLALGHDRCRGIVGDFDDTNRAEYTISSPRCTHMSTV